LRLTGTQIQSRDPLARLNAEVKRRTAVVDMFLNEAAITRLVGALLLERSSQRQSTRSVVRSRQLTLVQPSQDSYTTGWDTIPPRVNNSRLSAVPNRPPLRRVLL
jgi:hypothetical protein